MASKLIIDRIQPDMKLDENGNIVWTPRLIDYNAAAYSRGHVVTSDEFNTELLKQTYQGNYNTDTISVLVSFYNGINNTTKQALNTASNAEAKAVQADANAKSALSQISATVESANAALERANAAAVAVEGKPNKSYVDESVNTLAESVAEDLENYYTKNETDALDAQLLNTAKQYTNTEIAALIDSAPETLDTFKEIADAFAEDQEVLDTLNAAIGLKANQTSLNETNQTVLTMKTKLDGIEAGAEVNTVDSVNGKTGAVQLNAEDVGALPSDISLFSGDYNDLSNKPTLFSGDYNDLSNKPTIPTTYIKDASVTGDILTLEKQDGTKLQFEGGGGIEYTAGNGISIKDGVISGISIKELWKNPNISSYFVATTITLNSDDYDFLLIIWGANKNEILYENSCIVKKGNNISMNGVISSSSSPYVYTLNRSAVRNSDTSYTFDECYQSTPSGTNTANHRLIPKYIYGIKVV